MLADEGSVCFKEIQASERKTTFNTVSDAASNYSVVLHLSGVWCKVSDSLLLSLVSFTATLQHLSTAKTVCSGLLLLHLQ